MEIDFGQALKRLIKAKGIPVSKLAIKMNRGKSTIFRDWTLDHIYTKQLSEYLQALEYTWTDLLIEVLYEGKKELISPQEKLLIQLETANKANEGLKLAYEQSEKRAEDLEAKIKTLEAERKELLKKGKAPLREVAPAI